MDDNNCPEVTQWWENEFSYYNIKNVEKDKKEEIRMIIEKRLSPKIKINRRT